MPDKALIPGLAAKLKAARESAEMSAEQAAAAAGVHFTSIYRIEREERVPTLDVLYKLASAYGLKSVCDLLPPPPTPTPKKGKGKKP